MFHDWMTYQWSGGKGGKGKGRSSPPRSTTAPASPPAPSRRQDQGRAAGTSAPPTTSSESEAFALKRLSTATYGKLLGLKAALSGAHGLGIAVSEGRAHLTCPGLFELVIALDPLGLGSSSSSDKNKNASNAAEGPAPAAGGASEWSVREIRPLMGSRDGVEVLSRARLRAMAFQMQQVLADSREDPPLLSVIAHLKDLFAKLVLYTCTLQLNALVSEGYVLLPTLSASLSSSLSTSLFISLSHYSAIRSKT